MTAVLHPPKLRRHVFTVEEVFDLQERGVFADRKRVALHEGDIVEMAADGFRHVALTMALNSHIVRLLDPARYFIGVQTTLRFSRTNAPSPDIYILSGGAPESDVPPDRILLVIEVADTSLEDDLGEAAERYARAGVAEYWVADAVGREIYVHRQPDSGRYPPPRRASGAEALTPVRIPELQVALDQVWPAK